MTMGQLDRHALEQLPTATILATHGWRDYAERAARPLVTFAYTGKPTTVIETTMRGLLGKTRALGDTAALESFRRLFRVSTAFAGLSAAERAALEFTVDWALGKDAIEISAQRREAAWCSNPNLAELWDEMQATADKAAEAGRAAAEATAAAFRAKEEATAAAPALVLAMHGRGLRLDIAPDGRARAFPASLLDVAERAMLAAHNSIMAAAIQAELTTG